jgi:hypothetical protein
VKLFTKFRYLVDYFTGLKRTYDEIPYTHGKFSHARYIMRRPMSEHSPSTRAPAILLGALRRLVRPLVRVMLNHGVQYPMLLELLKSEFVHVAEAEFALDARAQTDSRISLLTGVHRKDVRRLRDTRIEDAPAPRTVALGAQIVATWTASPKLTDSRGRPLPLPRLRNNGGEKSFEALVESVSKDVRSRVVLDEWLRLGVARVDEDDRVCLDTGAFVPQKGFEEKVHYFGQNGHDHLAAMAHNLAGGKAPFVERSVYYSGLTPEAVAALTRLAERHGMRGIQAVNRRAAELKQSGAGKSEAVHRINFGIYLYSERKAALPASERSAPARPKRAARNG